MREFNEYKYYGSQKKYLFPEYDEFTKTLTDTSLRKVRSQVRNSLECPAAFIHDPDIDHAVRAVQKAVKTGMKPLFNEAMDKIHDEYNVYCQLNKLFYWDDNRKYKVPEGAETPVNPDTMSY